MAVVLALGTSVCYGVANYLGPLLTRRLGLGAVLLVGQVAALLAAAVLVVATGEHPPGAHDVLVAVLAGVGNAAGLAGLYRATELGPVSVAAPIGATGAILPVVWGLAHGDALKPLEGLGLVLALVGIVLSSRRPSRPEEAEREGDLRGCVLFAIGSALGFGILLIALPDASAGGRWWALLDARAALVAAVVVLVLARARPGRLPMPSLPGLALPGLLLLSGTILYVFAADRGALGVVSVLASLNPVVTVALAFALLGERLTRIQSAGVAAAIAGVVLIAA